MRRGTKEGLVFLAVWGTVFVVIVTAFVAGICSAAEPVEARRPSLGEWRSLQPILRRPVRFRPPMLIDDGGGIWWRRADGTYYAGSLVRRGWL